MSAIANSKLFSALHTGKNKNGPVKLGHRIVLAPLTRNRGTEPNLCPHQDHVDYYSQRATAGGLLITEAVNISPEAVGYISVPGIWTEEQTVAWRAVTNAVHAKGGKIFMQLWHTGRIAHPSFGDHPLLKRSGKEGMALPSVSASPSQMIHPKRKTPLPASTYQGAVEAAVPRELSMDEIPRLRQDYARAARNAMRAGFDGVELHAAHGYLIDQFIQDGVNKRTDAYGGSIENRCRLLCEVVQTLTETVGNGRLGVRLSPTTIDPNTGRQNQTYFAASCSNPDETYHYAVNAMNQFDLAYLLLTEPRWSPARDGDPSKDVGFTQPLSNKKYRDLYKGTLMAAGGFTPASAAKAIEDGDYDLVAFGRWFISNPDLPERIRTGAKLNVYNRKTFYTETINGGNAEGYTDYPSLDGTIGVPGKYELMDQSKIGANLKSSL